MKTQRYIPKKLDFIVVVFLNISFPLWIIKSVEVYHWKYITESMWTLELETGEHKLKYSLWMLLLTKSVILPTFKKEEFVYRGSLSILWVKTNNYLRIRSKLDNMCSWYTEYRIFLTLGTILGIWNWISLLSWIQKSSSILFAYLFIS